METLEEFDGEYPLVLSFCERISPQDYEGQGLSYTQKSLQELFTQMERKPSICERVVRKRKQAENERGNLGQYLKAKFFALLQGDVNYDNTLGEMEMEEKVEQLKREMEKANDYARAAKTSSWRPAERRVRRPILMGGFSPPESKLWDSGLPAMPKIFGSFPKQMERNNPDLKQLWAGMSPVNQKRSEARQGDGSCIEMSMVDLRPLMLNPGGFRPSFLTSNSVHRLKYAFPRVPASSSPTSPSQSSGPSSTTSVFNTPVLARFRGNKEDETDKGSPGPDTNSAGA
ncbi:uncharacterized protein LOC117657706 isoform X2 [Pantherophis guttatus]|nr:uncharacterized protein LOC117657706 isoform X2 [Pantherophis guttatus]